MTKRRAPTLLPASEGVTLEQAVLKWCHSAAVAELQQLARQGFPNPLFGFLDMQTGKLDTDLRNDRARELRTALEGELIAKLINGELIATGYDPRAPIGSKPSVIPPERWRELKPDFEKSHATTANLIITGILVFEAALETGQEPARAPPVAFAKLKKWYLSPWIDGHQRAGTIPTREEDLAAAQREFGDGVRREQIRRLRATLASDSWKRQGRRKLAEKTGR